MSSEGMLSDVCTKDKKKLWDRGIVPYVFNNNVNEVERFLKEAMNKIEVESESKVSFVKRTEDYKDYIEIIDKGNFASYVGRNGGRQELHISKDIYKYPKLVGHIMHELMHAIGFYHEHSHPKRDDYFVVKTSNINYVKQEESSIACYGGFDLHSIMMYPEIPGKMTLKQKTNFEIGQREGLSIVDKYALKKLYNHRTFDMVNGEPNPFD